MKVLWPFGVALRGEMPNRLMRPWLKTVVVSDEEKAALESSGGDQEGERERTAVEASKKQEMASEPGRVHSSGISLAGARLLARRCPGGRRREPDLRLLHGTWESGCR